MRVLLDEPPEGIAYPGLWRLYVAVFGEKPMFWHGAKAKWAWERMIEGMKGQQVGVLKRRFGISLHPDERLVPSKLREIAADFEVTTERVRQIEIRAARLAGRLPKKRKPR